jgi:hypothetical protein
VLKFSATPAGAKPTLGGFIGMAPTGCGKVALQAPSAAKAGVDFATLTARLKPRPFKTKSKSELFRSL